MTPSELKQKVEVTGSHFFDRQTLKFFGDTMSNYGVRSQPIRFKNNMGEVVTCWELYRKKAVKHGLKDSAFFDVITFERRFPKRELAI